MCARKEEPALGASMKVLGETLIVTLDGELDVHSASEFRAAVTGAFDERPRLRNLVLLMHGVTFVDSSGIGAILGRLKEVSARGGRLAVVGLQTPVERAFAMSGVLKRISVHDSEGQALASL